MNAKILFSTLCFLISCNAIFANERYLLVTKKTTLRAEPTSIAVKITRLAVNDTLLFLEKCDEHYCKVSFNGKVGWAKKKCFRELFPPAIEEEILEVEEDIIDATPPPAMKIDLPDSDAWDDLPYEEEEVMPAAKVSRKSPLENTFQRLRDVEGSVEEDEFDYDYDDYDDYEEEEYELADNFLDDDEGGLDGAGFLLVLVLGVVAYKLVPRS